MRLWNVILTSRDSKIGKPLLLILALREVNITFQRLCIIHKSFLLPVTFTKKHVVFNANLKKKHDSEDINNSFI